MVKCTECERYFEVVHKGQVFDLCDMDCFVDMIIEPWQEVECDFYVPLDVNNTKRTSNEA